MVHELVRYMKSVNMHGEKIKEMYFLFILFLLNKIISTVTCMEQTRVKLLTPLILEHLLKLIVDIYGNAANCNIRRDVSLCLQSQLE